MALIINIMMLKAKLLLSDVAQLFTPLVTEGNPGIGCGSKALLSL